MNKSAFEQAMNDNKIIRYQSSFERVVKKYDELSGRQELLEALKKAKEELIFLYVNNTKLSSFQPTAEIFTIINSALTKSEK